MKASLTQQSGSKLNLTSSYTSGGPRAFQKQPHTLHPSLHPPQSSGDTHSKSITKTINALHLPQFDNCQNRANMQIFYILILLPSLGLNFTFLFKIIGKKHQHVNIASQLN